MSYLTLDADRLVRDAVDAFLEGRLRPDPLPDTLYSTKNSRYRILAGLVHEASDTSLMGAELVGWLVEAAGSARIEPRWENDARAIFVERRSRHVVVTSRVVTRAIVSESRRAPAPIPPAPPIPQLKQAPSVAPRALVSIGGSDPAPKPPSRPPLPSDEEVTRVEYTEVADLDELEALRERSSQVGPLPKVPVLPPPAPSSDPRAPKPRLVAPRAATSSRPPPPRPRSSRSAAARPTPDAAASSSAAKSPSPRGSKPSASRPGAKPPPPKPSRRGD